MNHSPVGLHLNLDDAWPNEPLGLPVVDARSWGPQLRFSGPPRLVAEFYREHETHLAAPFMLYGSGDFHYLTALRLRRVAGPVVVVSFDNHPDWDVRPPKWGCGGWVNRAVELSQVRHVAVWGCGNFECWWPVQIFGNRRAERLGILEVHPWADDRPVKDRKRRGAILRDNWRKHYEQFLKSIVGEQRLHHNRSRLPSRGRGGDELGERPVHELPILSGRWEDCANLPESSAAIFAAHSQNRAMCAGNSALPRNSIIRSLRDRARTRFAELISQRSKSSGRCCCRARAPLAKPCGGNRSGCPTIYC